MATLQGQAINLEAQFVTGTGKNVDPLELNVYIFDQGSNPDEETVKIEDAVSVLNPVRIKKGSYQVEYEVPPDGEVGEWYALWIGSNNTNFFRKVTKFEVAHNHEINGLPTSKKVFLFNENTLYTIEIDGVESVDDEVISDEMVWFTSKYSPMYSSFQNILALMREWVLKLKEDAVNYSIWKYSEEADIITMPRVAPDEKYLRLAKRKFVEFSTVLNLLENFSGSSSTLKSKSLGDLKVIYADNQIGLGEAIRKTKKELEEWERVLNSGGTRVRGQSIGLVPTVVGINSGDRPWLGRDIYENKYGERAANSRIRKEKGIRTEPAYITPVTPSHIDRIGRDVW